MSVGATRLLAALLAASLLSGCFVLVEVAERRLESVAEALPVPEGATRSWTGRGCAGGCWGAPSSAFGQRFAEYAGGTDVTELTAALADALRGADWEVTQETASQLRRVLGRVAAQDDAHRLSCGVGHDEDQAASVTIDCYVYAR